jgi:hypothetical protein
MRRIAYACPKPRSDSMNSLGLALLMSCSLVFPFSQAEAQQMPSSEQISQHRQDSAPKPQNPKPEASQPSAELQSLIKALSGKWATEVRFEPNSEMPKGFSATGEETWRPGPGGFTLLEEEHDPTPAGDLFLLGVIWWDSKTNTLHGMECNNQLPYTCDLKGGLNDVTMSWDGKQFIINEWETHNGKKTLWREVWSEITPTSFTQTGESEEPGGARKRLFTVHATRVTDAR